MAERKRPGNIGRVSSLLSALYFALDCSVLLVATALAASRWTMGLPGLVERLVGFGLIALTMVAGAGVVLGATGGLGQPGFLGLHLATLLGLLLSGRASWRTQMAEAGRFFRALRFPAEVTRGERFAALALAAVALTLVALACWARPIVFDALTYRLSRIGHWLQEGRVETIGTDDARLNYMPVVPDLFVAWTLSSQAAGYAGAVVAQALGGCLALAATYGLARLTGLKRLAALGAAALLLGLPNVAPQFTSAYTDLFTTGVLAAGFYLWLAALHRGQGSVLGGVAAGLALGSKGTVVYFAPGLAVALAGLAWRYRAGRPAWVSTIMAGLISTAVFLGPTLIRNRQAYDGVAGPRDFVVWHQGEIASWNDSWAKLRLNLSSSLAQLAEPNSQPPWWRAQVRALGEKLVRSQPTSDPYVFDGIDRRENLEKIYALGTPDSDASSTGLLLPVLAVLAGLLACVRWRTATAGIALLWFAAIAGLVLVVHVRLQWHPYLYRFLVLGAPWLAVLVAWGLGQWPRLLRVVGWTVALATTAHGFTGALFFTYQSGWLAVASPVQLFSYRAYVELRQWAAALGPVDQPLRPALDVNAPLAAFYRQDPARRVVPQSLAKLRGLRAEDIVAREPGWLIAPAAEFIGREGRVMARSSLRNGDEGNPFKLVAFRALQPGEEPGTLLYRNRLVETGASIQRQLLVRTWSAAPVRLEIANVGTEAVHFVVRTPFGEASNELSAGGRWWFEAVLPSDRAAPVVIEYPRVRGVRLEARLLP